MRYATRQRTIPCGERRPAHAHHALSIEIDLEAEIRAATRPTAPRLAANTTSLTIGIDLGDRFSHYCVLAPDGEILDEGRVKTTRVALALRFGALAPARFAVETGTHANWVAEQLQQSGHTVLVANAREVQAITGSDRKCDAADAEKLARYARVDPSILRPITPRTSQTQAARAVIRVRAQLVSMRTGPSTPRVAWSKAWAIGCPVVMPINLPPAAVQPCRSNWPRRSACCWT